MSSETLQFVEVAAASDLAEGAMHAVEVDGERVLLALIEGRPYAMGAICTHERANLDEGSLVGHEVYCPLHFSCFDVRTGEALAPPADRATNVYAVRIEDGRVLVSTGPVAPEELGVGRRSRSRPSARPARRRPASRPPPRMAARSPTASSGGSRTATGSRSGRSGSAPRCGRSGRAGSAARSSTWSTAASPVTRSTRR